MKNKLRDGLLLNLFARVRDTEDLNEKSYLTQRIIAVMNEKVVYEIEDDG